MMLSLYNVCFLVFQQLVIILNVIRSWSFLCMLHIALKDSQIWGLQFKKKLNIEKANNCHSEHNKNIMAGIKL